MSDTQNAYDVPGRVESIKRHVSGTAVRNHQLADLALGAVSDQWMAGEDPDGVEDARKGPLRCRG